MNGCRCRKLQPAGTQQTMRETEHPRQTVMGATGETWQLPIKIQWQVLAYSPYGPRYLIVIVEQPVRRFGGLGFRIGGLEPGAIQPSRYAIDLGPGRQGSWFSASDAILLSEVMRSGLDWVQTRFHPRLFIFMGRPAREAEGGRNSRPRRRVAAYAPAVGS